MTGTTDAAGSVDLAVPFRRRVVQLITVTENGAVLARADCLEAGVACTIELTTAGPGPTTLGRVPITFDPAIPVPAVPTLVVTPSTGLAARPIVGISGSGFLPNHGVVLSQCYAALTVFGTELCGPQSTTASDAAGRISTIAIARRVLGVGLQATDCATSVGTCGFRATTDASTFYEPDTTEVARVPLGFDPTAPLPPGPPVTVAPTTGLADQQLVTVAGSGFPASDRIAIVPCRTTATFTPGVCDTTAPVTFLADGTGAFHVSYPAQQSFATSREQVDCSVSASTCVLAIVDYQDSSLATLGPISFASHGPTPVVAFRARSITEPTGADHSTKIDLELSEPTDHQVIVDWTTEGTGATAIGGYDYRVKYQTTIVPAGVTRVTVLVDVGGDRNDEPNEWFGMHMTSALGAIVGPDARITIRDDDPPPTVRLGDATVRENDGLRFVQVPVRLNAASASPVSVRFRTFQFTARAGTDYVDTTGTLVIPAGQTRGDIAVVILGDTVAESPETLLVTIDQPTKATIGDGNAVLTIHDDD